MTSSRSGRRRRLSSGIDASSRVGSGMGIVWGRTCPRRCPVG